MTPRRMLAIGLASTLALVLGPAHASEAGRVRADQHFIGVVNGNHTNAIVYTVCPGPATPGQTGHPAGSQFVAAIKLRTGGGFTGAATAIVAAFADDPSSTIELVRYGVARPIPTELELPCSGTGTVSFVPTPTSTVSIPDSVKVTFENIAV